MSSQANSSKYQQGFQLAIILSLLVMLVIPINIPTHSIQDEWIIHLTFEETLPSAENPHLNLTYHILSNLTEVNVVSDSVIAGDHVTLKASWDSALVNRSRLEVFAPAIPATLEENQNLTITEIDTRHLGNNATCTIIATGWLTNGSMIFETFQNVYIGNFFVPKITVTSPNGDEIWTGINNITWDASDVNVAESLLYDVLMSSDGGATFDILATSISNKWLEWNCSALDKLDTYLVEVRVTDGIYFSSDRSESTFTAGDIVHSTTTSTTTTTTTTGTNTTSTLDPRLTAFVVILLVSSSVMAIVVYYAAKKWF
ncbi:MAG: hypothetical protein KAU48_12460 [Candidatus Thorarchaeota archaeon]|nr:hypothetical protein [Candidatus Thorarchaeota archaeon]